MNHLKIFYISMETALKSHSDMKKHVIYIISSACLLEFLETFHTTQLYKIPLINLAWALQWFCAQAFRNIRTRYFRGISATVSGKWIPRKFVKDHKFSGLEIYLAKLGCTDIGYIRAMNGWSTSSTKMKKHLFTLTEMCENIQKKHELRKKFPKISKTHIAKTYLTELTSSLQEFNNHYLENDLENLHL